MTELKQAAYTFKNENLIPMFHKMRLEWQIIFLDLCKYCDANDLPRPTLTSLIRGRMPWSVSDTHADARAGDIRSRVYTKEEIHGMCDFINQKWAAIYGTGQEGKARVCLIFEDCGDNSHLHLQVKR